MSGGAEPELRPLIVPWSPSRNTQPVRALSRTDLETRLAARGLQQANRMATLLTEAEEARFSPSEAAELDAKQRWDEVRAMVTELKAFSKKGGG